VPKKTAESLTQAVVDALKPQAARYEAKDRDVPGLCVVCYPSGVRSWVLRYGPKHERRYVLGDAEGLTVKQARKAAEAQRVRIKAGADPSAERKAERLERQATKARAEAIEAGDLVPGTVAELAHRYLKTAKKRMKARGFAEVERHIAHIVAAWGARELSSIRRRDVIALIEARRDEAAEAGRHVEEARRGIVPAARLLAALSGLLNYAVTRDEMQANPARGIPRADLGLKETPRDRVLSEAEIRALWPALQAIGPVYGAAYRLILLTALRPGEVLALRWEDVQSDAHGRFIHLRGEATKESEARRVPLSAAARAELEAVRALNFDSPFVFASGGDAGFIRWLSNPTRRIVESSGVTFHPHDLRRTARTLLASLGVRHEVAERLLGHAVGSAVSRVYDRHSYDAEQQAAAERLGEKVASIVADEQP
jgi:integrase